MDSVCASCWMTPREMIMESHPFEWLDMRWRQMTSPAEKSLFPRLMVALSKVKPQLLWIVIAQAKAKGSWDQVRIFLPCLPTMQQLVWLESKRDQFCPIPVLEDLCFCAKKNYPTRITIALKKHNSRKISFLRIRCLIATDFLDNTLTSID